MPESRVTTNSPVMESVLDHVLKGDNRRLLMVGERPNAMILLFDKSGQKLIEGIVEERKKALEQAELALALCKLGQALNVEVSDA